MGKYGPEKTPFWDTFHIVQIILLPKVKWSKVIGNNNGIHDLPPRELVNDLSLRSWEIRKYQGNAKTS